MKYLFKSIFKKYIIQFFKEFLLRPFRPNSILYTFYDFAYNLKAAVLKCPSLNYSPKKFYCTGFRVPAFSALPPFVGLHPAFANSDWTSLILFWQVTNPVYSA
jgi:hypothetical protein